jgi:hypothetical protein
MKLVDDLYLERLKARENVSYMILKMPTKLRILVILSVCVGERMD